MDGPEDTSHSFGLALGHSHLPVALGVGHGPDCIGLAFGLQDRLLLDRLGAQDHGLLVALGAGDCRLAGAVGFQNHGTPRPLGLHLLVHGVHHIERRIDPLDLDADHPDAPLVGGVVEHLAHGDVDVVP